MTDQAQATQWALDQFDGFVKNWTPPAAIGFIAQRGSVTHVRQAIKAIAPKDDVRP